MNRLQCTAVTYIRQRRKCHSSVDRLLLFSTIFLLFQIACGASSSLYADKQTDSAASDMENVKWLTAKVDFASKIANAVVSHEQQLPREDEAAFYEDSAKTQNSEPQAGSDLLLANDNIATKRELSKIPKKYAHPNRKRRNADADHIVRKRHPHIQYHADHYPASNHVGQPCNQNYLPDYKRHPVQGNLWNGIDRPVPAALPLPMSFGNRNSGIDDERIIWERFRPVAASSIFASPPRTTTQSSIFHNANPADADMSLFTRRPQQRPTPRPTTPTTTSRPRITTAPSIFHDTNPNNADLSFFRQRSNTQPKLTTDNIFLRSSSIDDEMDYDTSHIQAQKASDYEAFCAFAIVSCCRQPVDLQAKCFTDWKCYFTSAQIWQQCH